MEQTGPVDENTKLPQRRSVRLKRFDYSQPGLYFVTICARNRRCLFGKVENEKVRLNVLGQIVEQAWLEIPRHFPNVELHAYVVMPNHLHGILAIHKRARHAVPLRGAPAHAEAFGTPVRGSLATIVRSFKSAVSKRARGIRNFTRKPILQRGYYEHLLRDAEDFANATRYILENSKAWTFDKENPQRKDKRPA
jgi:REP element-mobilizing transposase RayT